MFSKTDSLEQFVISLSYCSLMNTAPGEPRNEIVIDSTVLDMVHVKSLAIVSDMAAMERFQYT